MLVGVLAVCASRPFEQDVGWNICRGDREASIYA
jgi:hypothetical protein